MSSTFHGLEIGKRSLYAQQAALNTTGHNISNSNTVGYTRQRVDLVASRSIHYPGMNNDRSPQQLGTGVSPSQITRIREDYLDLQFRNESAAAGYWDAMSNVYMKMEGIFNEPSDSGLQHVMDQFWQGWQELSKNPESMAARAVVAERGVTVADTFNHLGVSLERLKTDLENQMKTKVDEINSIAKQISDLNDQIGRLVPHGHNPNDLYDKRDVLIDQLSKLVDVEVKPADFAGIDPDKHGMVEVTIDKGAVLLVSPDPSKSPEELEWEDGALSVSLNPGTGELMGIYEGIQKVSETLDQLDLYASTFASVLNGAHESGVGLNNSGGTPFFEGSDAHSIKVNQAILDSLDLIAAASGAVHGNEGDGTNAQNIADIKFDDEINLDGDESTFDDFYRMMMSQLGVRSQEASRMAENSGVLLNQIDMQRQSVSGVSLDEEMVNMIRYQQAYNAAARFVTTIDEVLDRVVNGMGRVGL